jgi:RNA polymerase sigma-70 factor (sigma-E family)
MTYVEAGAGSIRVPLAGPDRVSGSGRGRRRPATEQDGGTVLEGTLTRLRRSREDRPARAVPEDERRAVDRAVSDLYERHRVGLTRLAVLLVDDEQTAQDVVQEAFAGLYRRWSELRPASAEQAQNYVRSAVLNASRSVLRRRRTVRGYVPDHVPHARSAESLALLQVEHQAVLRALGRVAPRQREVLVLRYWAGLSEAEIASATGLSAGGVKSTASRGLAALEKQLKENS